MYTVLVKSLEKYDFYVFTKLQYCSIKKYSRPFFNKKRSIIIYFKMLYISVMQSWIFSIITPVSHDPVFNRN